MRKQCRIDRRTAVLFSRERGDIRRRKRRRRSGTHADASDKEKGKQTRKRSDAPLCWIAALFAGARGAGSRCLLVCRQLSYQLFSLLAPRRMSSHLDLLPTLCDIVGVKFASADGWSQCCAAPEERCCYLSADSLFGEQGEGRARGSADDLSLLLYEASAGVLETRSPS